MKRILVLALFAVAGCGGGGSQPSDRDVISGWIDAVNEGEFGDAADYFAEGAIVEQEREIVLVNRAAAITFNRSLPCRADLTGTQDDRSGTLAMFDLRTGRSGACSEGGSARVLFVIRDGLINEWRQLPEAPLPADSETAWRLG